MLWITLAISLAGNSTLAEPLSIGIQNSPASTLILVAKERGYFAQRGLEVDVQVFTAGKFALQAFLSGSVGAVVAGEFPILLAEGRGLRVPVIAEVVTTSHAEVRLLGRRDPGSSSLREYFANRRRIVATSIGGGPEFFLHTILQEAGVTESDVTIVSQRPEDMPAALISGSVDAVTVFEPYARIAELQLGADSVSFTRQDTYRQHYLFAVTDKILEESPQAVIKALLAMRDAEQFVESRPDEAKEILRRATSLSRKVLDDIWENYTFNIGLSTDLESVWNREISWLRHRNVSGNPFIAPNPKSILVPEFLRRTFDLNREAK